MNVWFAEYAFAERTNAMLALLVGLQPDLIALQTQWIRAAYRVSDISGASVDPYGVLMLSRCVI